MAKLLCSVFKINDTQCIFQALSIPDRAHLLDDIFSLAEARLVSYHLAMNMTRYLAAEMEYIPWRVASTKFNTLNRLLISSPSYGKFRVRKYSTTY